MYFPAEAIIGNIKFTGFCYWIFSNNERHSTVSLIVCIRQNKYLRNLWNSSGNFLFSFYSGNTGTFIYSYFFQTFGLKSLYVEPLKNLNGRSSILQFSKYYKTREVNSRPCLIPKIPKISHKRGISFVANMSLKKLVKQYSRCVRMFLRLIEIMEVKFLSISFWI